VHGLESQAPDIRHDAYETAAQERCWEKWSCEEAAHACARFSLEDQGRPKPHDPQPGMFAFKSVEAALHLGLVTGVEARRHAVSRPALVHQPVLRARRVHAHRGRVDKRPDTGLQRGPERAGGALDVRAPQRVQIARRLDSPGEVHDGVRFPEGAREVVAVHVGGQPLGLLRLERRPATRYPNDGRHGVVRGERANEARADVARRACHRDPHAVDPSSTSD
jgi:hypothetical protein